MYILKENLAEGLAKGKKRVGEMGALSYEELMIGKTARREMVGAMGALPQEEVMISKMCNPKEVS